MVTLLFVGFAASVGWLRWKTVGREGLGTSLLIGVALGLNSFWIIGFYNFLLGIIGLNFTLGLFYGWREEMNWRRTIVISLLFLAVYFSHLTSFGILAGSVFLLVLFAAQPNLKKAFFWTSLTILPVLPFVYVYKSLTANAGGFYPHWQTPNNPFSILEWFYRIRIADPLQLMGWRNFPFTTDYNEYFKLFTPLLWLLIAFLILTALTVYALNKQQIFSRQHLPFVFLFIFSILLTMFSPDSFGFQHGGYLRERILFCALIFLVPIFRLGKSVWLKKIAQFCLLFVIVFQTSALWDYALQTNREAKEFLSAGEALNQRDHTLASVILLDEAPRFHSRPIAQMSNYLGVEKKIVALDNYEMGYYLFPIVAKNRVDQQFILSYKYVNTFYLSNSEKTIENSLAAFEACLQQNHHKITTLIVWGQDARIDAVINKWFNSEPAFSNGRVRLFRHQ